MQNVELPELLGPAIMQVNGFIDRSHSYMTDICHLPFLYLHLKEARQNNRMELNFYHVNAFS